MERTHENAITKKCAFDKTRTCDGCECMAWTWLETSTMLGYCQRIGNKDG